MIYPPNMPQFVSSERNFHVDGFQQPLDRLLQIEDVLRSALTYLGALSVDESVDVFFLRRKLEEALQQVLQMKKALAKP